VGHPSRKYLELAEDLFDRVEVRSLRRQISCHCVRRDLLRHAGEFMSCKVIQEDDVTAVELGRHRSTSVRKMLPSSGPSITKDATIASWCRPASKVIVFQRP
jgi:hypothetical protein